MKSFAKQTAENLWALMQKEIQFQGIDENPDTKCLLRFVRAGFIIHATRYLEDLELTSQTPTTGD